MRNENFMWVQLELSQLGDSNGIRIIFFHVAPFLTLENISQVTVTT